MAVQHKSKATDAITAFAAWVNEHIVGNPWALVICILFVVTVFSLILVQGYSQWNLSTGLFANDAESAYELITGTASVVAVISLHKKHREHTKHLEAINQKLSKLQKVTK